MAANPSSRKTRRATAAAPRERRERRAFPARTLHLIDIENLAGAGLPAEWQVAGLRRAYAHQVGLGPMDQVIIGCNHKALSAAGHGWPGARYLIRSGPDGADTELLAVLASEHIAARFTNVAIASGDHAFTHAAATLAAGGCHVTIISRSQALARTLRLAAQHLIYLDTPAAAPATPRPGAA